MRFLVITRPSHPLPPSAELMDAMEAWVDGHMQSGKMEQTWSFAGVGGGGGILDVDSNEELGEIMGGFPLAPFSDVEVFPLSDLHDALDRVRALLEQMPRG